MNKPFCTVVLAKKVWVQNCRCAELGESAPEWFGFYSDFGFAFNGYLFSLCRADPDTSFYAL